MSHDLVAYLMQEKIAEYERKRADLNQQLAASTLREQQAFQQILETFLRVQFPDMPPSSSQTIHPITDPNRLQHLFRSLTQAPDVAAAVQVLTQAAAEERAVTGSER